VFLPGFCFPGPGGFHLRACPHSELGGPSLEGRLRAKVDSLAEIV
jgi:hypothetical protein